MVFLDEPGFQLTPVVRRTYAPRGETPLLEAWASLASHLSPQPSQMRSSHSRENGFANCR